MMKKQIKKISLIFLTACMTGLLSSAPIRVCCIGDSVTQGNGTREANGGYSWRYWFWQKLVQDGTEVDMVGSLNRTFQRNLSSPPPRVNGLAFDRDHEGHWGWKADEVINGRNTPNSTNGTGKLSDWLNGYTADVSIIILGLNDVFRERSTPINQFANSLRDEFRTIVRTLQSDNPGMTILVCSIPNTVNATVTRANAVNALLSSQAGGWSTNTSKVVYANINQNYTGSRNVQTYDGTHPTAVGEKVLANNIYNAFKNNVSTSPTSPTSPPPPALPIGSVISLKGNNGRYVSSEFGNAPMICNRGAVGAWEKFTVVDAGSGQISFRSSNGKYVSSENSARPITASRNTNGGWEKFTVRATGANQVSIQGNTGQYISSENGNGPMNCNRGAVGAWEKFTWKRE